MTCHDIVATGRYPYRTTGFLTQEDERLQLKKPDAVHAQNLATVILSRSVTDKQRVLLEQSVRIRM